MSEILIAFFSASGHTAKLAGKLATAVQGAFHHRYIYGKL